MADGRSKGSDDVGRAATRPREIPARGWREVLGRVWREMDADNVGFVAAALAYHAIFAIFPALAAAVSVWGLFADPAVLEAQIGELAAALPAEIAQLLGDQLRAIAGASGEALGATALFGLLVALWSASRAMSGLMSALNLVYEERESRGFVRRTLVAVGLTACGLAFALVALALLAVLPPAVEALGFGEVGAAALRIGRWPLLAAAMVAFLALLFRFAPSRAQPQWRWVSPGALTATALWLGGSALFTLYVARFGTFNETYGALGAVAVFLLWLYLTGYALLVGAELNAELEMQTAEDSTTGPPRPLGERGAFVADRLPEDDAARPSPPPEQ